MKIERVKYPRTKHMPFSLGRGDDDKVLDNLNHFIGKEVVVTEKMDGENTTLYPDYYSHARSIDSKNHPSRDWVKAYHSEIAYNIPNGGRLCGENLYAKHSIEYNELESFFYVFSIWDDQNYCYSWHTTESFCKLHNIKTVPVLWQGMFNEHQILNLALRLDPLKQEGLVLRVADWFHYDDFDKSVAKYVRADHVQSDKHWQHQQIIPNKLKQI